MHGIGTNGFTRDLKTGARQRVVACAENELGNRDPRPYWLDAFGSIPHPLDPYAWCGVFALYCLRRAGLTDWLWRMGNGFIYVGGKQRLPITEQPEPGDIAYFDKPKQHYAVVVRAEVDGVSVIAGNTPTVRRSLVPACRYGVVYFSIANLLPD